MGRHERNRRRLLDRAARDRRERNLPRVETDYRRGAAQAQPARITLALDSRALDGPEVDRACLAEEPSVDQWEAGEAAPSWEQLLALGDLTGYPVEFFLRPAEETMGPAMICGPRGCEVVGPSPVVAPLAPVVRLYPDTLF
jgi:hypothetical protein